MGSVFRPAGRTKYKIKYCGADGRWITESTGSDDLDTATKLLASREGKVAEGMPLVRGVGQLTLDDAWAAVAADYRANDQDTLDAADSRYRLHLAPYFGATTKIAGITTGQIRAYTDHRLAQPVQWTRTSRTGITYTTRPRKARTTARATINRELALLQRMINLGIENGAILHGPYVPMLKENNTRKGFFEAAQFAAICKHLPAHLVPIAQFAYVTGWRVPSEILPLEWSRVDMHARVSPSQVVPGTVTIDVGEDKNEGGRVFPFTPEIARILKAQAVIRERCRKAGTISPYVFVRIFANGAVKRITNYRAAWNTAAIAAGLPGKLAHDFRRTAARNLVRSGITESVAMRLTGHRTRAVFDRYNIVADSDLAAAAARYGDSHPGPTGRKRDQSGTKQGPFQAHSGKVRSRNP